MANHRKTPIDFCRVKTWARACGVALGLRAPTAIERRLLELHGAGKPKAVSGAWGGYLDGTSVPYNGWGPVPESQWAQLARRVLPPTWPWFATPFWHLVRDQEFTPSQVVECIELLPERFREALLYDPPVHVPAAMRLKDVHYHWVYQFTNPLTPWALGATACALRRAELAGDAATVRWCGVALVWQLDQHAKIKDPWVAEPLLEVRDMLLARFERAVYLDGLRLAIAPSDLARFSTERAKFIAWNEKDPTEAGFRPRPPGEDARIASRRDLSEHDTVHRPD